MSDEICTTCRGSGEGPHGPIGSSRCSDCNGSGVEPDPMEAYAAEELDELRAEMAEERRLEDMEDD
jgi:hypothetical protein